MESRKINATDYELEDAFRAIYSELEYQENLNRRTDDEAKKPIEFVTLARVYERELEELWVKNPTPEVKHEINQILRKLAAIYTRAMLYNGVEYRNT